MLVVTTVSGFSATYDNKILFANQWIYICAIIVIKQYIYIYEYENPNHWSITSEKNVVTFYEHVKLADVITIISIEVWKTSLPKLLSC